MTELFNLRTVLPTWKGYKSVDLDFFVELRKHKLFGPDGSLGIRYSDVIERYDANDPHIEYAEMALEEYFTRDEATAFAEWVKRHRNDDQTIIRPVTLPIRNNIMGTGAIAVGGGADFLMISDADDYDLPFKVWGYYDLAAGHSYERLDQPLIAT